MYMCPECKKYGLDFDGYFQRFICHSCDSSEMSSDKIKEFAHNDAVKGTCKVCKGSIIKYRTVNSVLHCEECGIVYHKIPKEK